MPPPNGGFDNQISGDYSLPTGDASVSRDWFAGTPAVDGYNVCHISAFPTPDNDDSADRPDEQDNWPANLALTNVDQDPNWEGKYLIDISTANKRVAAAALLQPAIQACTIKGLTSSSQSHAAGTTSLLPPSSAGSGPAYRKPPSKGSR